MRVLRVLLVDDDPSFLEFAGTSLSAARYSVASASDFESAAAALDGFRGKAVVLSDLSVKGSSALDFLAGTLARYPHVPFTLLARSPTLEAVIEALQQGAYDFLRKPVDRDILCHSVARSVEKLNLMLDGEKQEEENRRLLGRSRADLDRLRQLSDFKSFLISTTAHDFNSTLTVLDGYHQVIRNRCKGLEEPATTNLLEQIRRSITRLRTMSATVLDFEAAERGELTLTPREFDVRELLEECVAFYRMYAEQKQVVMAMEENVPTLVASGDPGRVMQVLDNLVYNAVKFTPPGGEIYVGARADEDGTATIWVRDTGIGIPRKTAEKIFEQAGTGGDKNGTARMGLGLVICRRLVEMQKGKIWMESAPGKGTVVSFTLPM